jgi:hypothetical protein
MGEWVRQDLAAMALSTATSIRAPVSTRHGNTSTATG